MLDARLNERRGKRAPHHDTRPLAAVKLVEDVAVGAERLGARLEKGRGVDACVQEGLQCGAVQHVGVDSLRARHGAAQVTGATMRWFFVGILTWGCGASSTTDARSADAVVIEQDAARRVADAAFMPDAQESDARASLDAGPADIGPAELVDAGPVDARVRDAEPDVAPVVAALTLPQALGGALRVNPVAQPSVNLRVRVEGEPREVTLRVAGGDPIRAEQAGDEWLALLGVEALPDGAHRLEVTATGFGPDVSVAAELVVSREGLQLTDFFTVGRAGTPRLHRQDERLFLT